MTLHISSLMSAVKRHLSIIGKRLYNKEGKNLFSDITLSSAEDTQILTQYIHASAEDVEAACRQFVTSFALTGPDVVIELTNTRASLDFPSRCEELVTSYIVLNTVGEYLSMMHPDLARKYHDNAAQRMEALLVYVIYKNPPTADSHSYANITGTINN